MLYPLKFKPIYKEKIWGGKKLTTLLNKKGFTSEASARYCSLNFQKTLSVALCPLI